MTSERAAELVQALKPHAHRAVQAAEQWLAAHYPGITPSRYAVPASHLAGQWIEPHMTALPIGVVSVRTPGGDVCVVQVAVSRDGGLVIGVEGEDRRLRWTTQRTDVAQWARRYGKG